MTQTIVVSPKIYHRFNDKDCFECDGTADTPHYLLRVWDDRPANCYIENDEEGILIGTGAYQLALMTI